MTEEQYELLTSETMQTKNKLAERMANIRLWCVQECKKIKACNEFMTPEDVLLLLNHVIDMTDIDTYVSVEKTRD